MDDWNIVGKIMSVNMNSRGTVVAGDVCYPVGAIGFGSRLGWWCRSPVLQSAWRWRLSVGMTSATVDMHDADVAAVATLSADDVLTLWDANPPLVRRCNAVRRDGAKALAERKRGEVSNYGSRFLTWCIDRSQMYEVLDVGSSLHQLLQSESES